MDNGAAALGLSWLSCLCFCVNNGAEKSLLSKPIKAFLLCNVSVSRCTHLSLTLCLCLSGCTFCCLLCSDSGSDWPRAPLSLRQLKSPHCSLLCTGQERLVRCEVRQLWSQRTEAGSALRTQPRPASQQVTAASAGLLRLLPAAGPCHCLHSLRPVPVCCRTLAALHSKVKTRHWLTQAPWAGPNHVSAPALML